MKNVGYTVVTVFGLLLTVCLLCAGCGDSEGAVSVDLYSAEDDTEVISQAYSGSAVDSEVYEPESIVYDTEAYEDVFSEDFNSYYTVKDGKAVAMTGNTSSSSESTEGVESAAEDASVEIVFNDSHRDNTSASTSGASSSDDSIVNTPQYSMVSNITKTVSESNPFVEFKNDGKYSARFVISDGETSLFDTGVLESGKSVNWNAYEQLANGYHELGYHYEQMDGKTALLTYDGIANITVEKVED